MSSQMIRWRRARPGPGPRGKLCAALAAAAALAAQPAWADARAEAKRHFRDGMALIAAGQVERGISELKQAYAIKPHADVLYDIAKAYVELGNIPEALVYFRQYVATNPADKEQVQGVIRRLESAIGSNAPAAPPPQAAELEQLMAQLRELIEKAQKQTAPAAPSAKSAVSRPDDARKPAASARPEEEMFEGQTIYAKTRASATEIAAERLRLLGQSAGVLDRDR